MTDAAKGKLEALKVIEKLMHDEIAKMRVTLKGLLPEIPQKPVKNCADGEVFSPILMGCIPSELS